MTTDTDNIKIKTFESKYQVDVENLFKTGLSESYKHARHVVQKCQNWFINDKLTGSGDMVNIYESYIKNDSKDSSTFKSFWVAIESEQTDNNNEKVLGAIGLIESTYPETDEIIYENGSIQSNDVCELVRLSVHKDSRGKGIGKRLNDTVEKYAIERGKKKIVLTTLMEMDLAVNLYKNVDKILSKLQLYQEL